MFWAPQDFLLNKAFWNHWGHDAALPFRLRNLAEIQSVFSTHGIPNWLTGGSLRSAATFGELLEDHDDDVEVDLSDGDFAMAQKSLAEKGFTIIRSSESMWSFARWNRYIDVHLAPHKSDGPVRIVLVNGVPLAVPSSCPALPEQTSANTRWHSVTHFLQDRHRLARGLQSPRSSARSVLLMIQERKKRTKKRKRIQGAQKLSRSEFLALKIDTDSSVNWVWRGPSYLAVFRKGETFGQALLRLRDAGLPRGTSCDTSYPFDEPLHLSYRFWKCSSDHFAAPLRYGFRHLVMPYAAANLYINAIRTPLLFGDEYYSNLPRMTTLEIEKFLARRPLEVRSGALSSGRHRAMTMLGRLVRGEDYIPFSVVYA